MAKCEGLGSGLYPTAALFNHSCHPNIMRVNVGRRMVIFLKQHSNNVLLVSMLDLKLGVFESALHTR